MFEQKNFKKFKKYVKKNCTNFEQKNKKVKFFPNNFSTEFGSPRLKRKYFVEI